MKDEIKLLDNLPIVTDWLCILMGITWQCLAIYGLIRLFV